MGMIDLFPVEDPTDIEELRTLITNHITYTGSTVAQRAIDRVGKA